MKQPDPSTLTSSAAPHWSCADAFLFDIDGTLLNSRDPVHYWAYHNAVRSVFNVDSRVDGIPVQGNTDIGILRAVLRREGLSDEEFNPKIPQLIAHMSGEVQRNFNQLYPELCPSIRELLEAMQRAGKLLGIASGNVGAVAWLKLQAAGLRHFFEFGCFSDQYELRADIFRQGVAEARRRLGPGSSVCFVGDTPADIQAAHAAGASVVAVATGVFALDALREHHPDICVPSCEELLELF